MAQLQIDNFSCSRCGGNLEYFPDGECLKCSKCENITKIVKEKTHSKRKLDSGENDKAASIEWANENKFASCPNCGAHVMLSKFDVAGVCPYCSTALVADTSEFQGVKPDAIIPFKFNKDKAKEVFKETMRSKFFAPTKFKKNIPAVEIQGYYFPSFVFDTQSETSYFGIIEIDHSHTDSKGRTHTTVERKHISGNHSEFFKDFEMEASDKLTQKELEYVTPYFFNNAFDYSSAFVAGYSIECNSATLKQSWKDAKEELKGIIKTHILNQYHYSRVVLFTMNEKFYNPKYMLAMLPIYRVNYTYNGKKYSNMINGQSGKVGGKTPKSAIKITILVLLILLAFALPLYFLLR